MTEYINKQRLIDEFTGPGGYTVYGEFVRAIVARINLQPAADVAPVVHARWSQEKSVTLNFEQRLDNCGTQYRCSKCGRRAGYKQVRLYLYCPHCGAKMDGTEANL